MHVRSLTPFPLPHCLGKKKDQSAVNKKPSAAALPEGESLIDPYPLRWHARAFTDSLFLSLTVQGSGQERRDSKREWRQ